MTSTNDIRERLAAAGKERSRRRAATAKATREAKLLAVEASQEHDVSQTEIARLLEVPRVTVRAWLGL